MIKKLAGKAILKAMRYRQISLPVETPRAVLLGVPHTSNKDYLIMLGLMWSNGMTPKVLIKDTYFRGPLKYIAKALGGLKVDRSDPGGLVDQLVSLASEGDEFLLVIAPKGTRSKTEYWKSGFYRIAQAADLPLVLGWVDGPSRTAGLGPTIEVTGDVKADMDVIRAFYADKRGIKPENRTEPRLRMEELPASQAG